MILTLVSSEGAARRWACVLSSLGLTRLEHPPARDTASKRQLISVPGRKSGLYELYELLCKGTLGSSEGHWLLWFLSVFACLIVVPK